MTNDSSNSHQWYLHNNQDISHVRKDVHQLFPSRSIKARDKLSFTEEYLVWLITNKKTTTVRYAYGKVDLPESVILPIGVAVRGKSRSVDEAGCENKNKSENGYTKRLFIPWGVARITKIEIKRFSELDNQDAIRDGFRNADELKSALEYLYNHKIDNDYITIYTLVPIRKRRGTLASLGLHFGQTSYGKHIKNGGATLVEDGKLLVSLAEERVTRQKADGGFESSLEAIMSGSNCAGSHFMSDIGLAVTSSCVDFPEVKYDLPGDGYVQTIRVSHHFSHALSTFILSPFDESIVIVMDAGGDILEHRDNRRGLDWWKYAREQVSCYIGRGSHLELLCRFFDKPFDTGFGEMYRAFTHYLGWESYIYSANTMALAAYGSRERFSGVDLFPFDEDLGFRSIVDNDPRYPIRMIETLSRSYGLEFPKCRTPSSSAEPMKDIETEYKDMAAFVQSELEKALVRLVSWLINKTKIKKVCLAGGVALNCVANTTILERTEATDLFVVPAAEDTGQSMGNALFGHFFLGGRREDIEEFHPFLGPKYPAPSVERVRGMLARHNFDNEIGISAPSEDKYIAYAAEKIAQGKIVGWFNGRSEFGPRALGHRSILADPRQEHTSRVAQKLRKIKGRQWFRPFSPSILEEFAHDYFDLPAKSSPYMLLVGRAHPRTAKLVPLVVHVDGTSRLQTVSLVDNGLFYKLIKAFFEITGVPLVLNTSFNRKDEPIVEKPEEAIDMFVHTELDILVLGNIVLEKLRESTLTMSHYAQYNE